MDEFHNPYPGARPLRAEENGLLLGRDQKLDDLVDAIRATPVVEFTAPSGLGKSSLLEAGVLPLLKGEGFEAAPLRSWAGLGAPRQEPAAAPIADYYSAAVSAALRAGGIDDRGYRGEELLFFLADAYGPTLVVIFDQFEELLRDDPTLGRRFLERVVHAAKTFPFRQVVSMRSEFKEELRVIEENLRHNQWIWVGLEDVPDEIAADIVTAPLKSLARPFSWDKEVIESISEWWKAARRRDWKIGLLHLQAFLWSAVQQLQPAPDSEITDSAIRNLISTWLAPDGGQFEIPDADPLDLFRASLTVYVDLRLGTPMTTPDPKLRQALYAASRYSAELSSAGYKLVRDTVELARFAFPGVKGELSYSDAFIDEAVRRAESQLLGSDAEAVLSSLADTLPKQVENDFAQRKIPLEEGQKEGAAGAMIGRSALDTACAEIAAYERSLQLLADRSLIRITSSLDGRRRVALIHDGFGEAMDVWGKKVGRDPLAAIESTTALSAKQLLRGLGEAGLDRERLALMGIGEIKNVSWIGCYITANIRDWVFKNCRFSSTLFKDCEFQNVRFENCEFRGALFLGCTFKGEEGTVIAVTEPNERERCRVSAVTVKKSGMAGGGLAFDGMVGTGLLFEECYGGPWRLIRCELRHVSIHGTFDESLGQTPLWGRIDLSPEIMNFSITGRVGEETVVRDSWIYMGTYPSGHRLNAKGRAQPDFTGPEPQSRPVTQEPTVES